MSAIVETPPLVGPEDGVIHDARERQRRHRTVAVALVVAVVAACVAVLGSAGSVKDGRGGVGVPRQPLQIAAHEAVSELRVPAGVVDVATVDGGVWVSGFGAVTRIDTATRRMIVIKTPRTDDFSHIAVGDGSVWVTGLGTVYRIDPHLIRVVAAIHVGDAAVVGVAVGAGRVWVAVPRDGPGEVVQIDPSTNKVIGSPIEIGPGPSQVSYGEGAVWVQNTSPPSTMRIDPATHRVSVAPTILAVGEPATVSVLAAYGSVWDAGADALTRLGPRSGTVVARIAILRAQQVVSGDGGLWVVAGPLSSTSSVFTPVKGTARLWEVDPRTNRIIGQPARLDALEPIGLAVSRNAVWIGDYNRATVTRIPLVR